MTPEQKSWIDNASYQEMLSKNRFSDLCDPMFIGDTGTYFQKKMHEKKMALPPGQSVQASKNVGWEK